MIARVAHVLSLIVVRIKWMTGDQPRCYFDQ